ncbi:MAG: bifunctional phosphoribosyl-AMP cyclohydrolase/phosphoribosyl-ATP diphosphatase [Chloroflexi bacterium]|nr:bifunctional phosphoribosyl-AMP cyclohydrolase/phosphoribosyl-ATP diphosphatase [Chloroflexota bacterium]
MNKQLLPAIIQDENTKNILMLGYMNEEALNKTIAGPNVWFFSRSRKTLWEKGETSGNYLRVKKINIDCDMDSILVTAIPEGPTCHTGNISCFESTANKKDSIFNSLNENNQSEIIDKLIEIISERKTNNNIKTSYTSKLLNSGIKRISQKVVEEAGEVAIACVSNDKEEIINEFSDLIYHMLVLIEASPITYGDVWAQLNSRMKK